MLIGQLINAKGENKRGRLSPAMQFLHGFTADDAGVIALTKGAAHHRILPDAFGCKASLSCAPLIFDTARRFGLLCFALSDVLLLC